MKTIIAIIFFWQFLVYSPNSLAETDINECLKDFSNHSVPETLDDNDNIADYTEQGKYIAFCEEALTNANAFNEKDNRTLIINNLTQLKSKLIANQNLTPFLTRISGNDYFEIAYKAKAATEPYIKKINILLEQKKPQYLIPSWRDIAYSYQFYTGIEYNKVGELFDDSTLRLGFQGYLRLGKGIEKLRNSQDGECDLYSSCGRWFKNLPHIIGNVVLTGAAETAAVPEGQDSDSKQTEEDDNLNFESIEYELAIFYPLYLGSRGSSKKSTYQEFAIGPIAVAGGRKTDELDSFQNRYYLGFRFSNNEETYLDLLYGKSQPLQGKRAEIRGQLPVSTLGTGRLFLGGAVNFEVKRKAKNGLGELISEADSFKIYLTWQTTFDDLWKGLSSDGNG